jgi:uncharacterized membrane protein
MADQITKSITVKGDVTRAYEAWRNFENFPYFMDYVQKVEVLDPKISHWEIKGPLGKTVEWNAELTRDEPNKRIGWNTKDHEGTVTTSGQVTFNQLPENQTQVTVQMQYTPPGGKLGQLVADVFANPEHRVVEDLNNFKRYIEGSSI